jgi:hypothetical protein
MKTKKRRQSRKKRVGGASGLVLIIEYDEFGNIKNIKIQNMLARHEYMSRNKIDPATSLSDEFRGQFNLDRLQQIFRDFLYLPDNGNRAKRKTQKKRIVNIAVNDKSDIALIQLVNIVIKRLNGIQNKRTQQKLFIIRDAAGNLTNKTQLEFRKRYEELLAGEFIEDYKNEKKTEVDEELLKRLMRMPVLMNLVSIKYGLINRGDIKLEELQNIYNLDNGRIFDLVKLGKKARPDVMTYDQIMQEENEKLAKQNEELKNQLIGGLNEENEPDMVVFGEAPAEVPTEVSAVQGVVQTSVVSNPAPVLKVGNRMVSNGASMVAPVSASNSNKGSIVASPPVVSNSNQAPSVAPPVAANAQGQPQELDMSNPRVIAIKQFNDLLLRKYGGSSDTINQNTTDFFNELKTTKSDPVKLMQYYLIKNILVCIDVDEEDLYQTTTLETDSNKRQATILFLIRILLTRDMKNFKKFKTEFDKNKNFCKMIETLANNQSGLFGQAFRKTTWLNRFSYDSIIDSTKNLCPIYNKSTKKYEGDPNYNAMITIHLNKLYDLFQTKDPEYIQHMVSKSYGNKVTTVDNYDETYTPGNQNYIFS